MVIKSLEKVSTKNEQQLINNVRWSKVSTIKGAYSRSKKFENGKITGVWTNGCSLTSKEKLREGENVWIIAETTNGELFFSSFGTVIWSESCYHKNGYRCEIRLRSGFEYLDVET